MTTQALEFAAKTDTGMVRSQNEDTIAISPEYGLAILADGMGGYNAGEVASRIAADVLRQSLESELDRMQQRGFGLLQSRERQLHQLLAAAIHDANAAILDAAQAEPELNGMGTTLVTALFHDDRLTIAHVGDSRAYRLRGEELLQLTRDHSLLQEQIDAGLLTVEAARFAPHRNLVTRAVGIALDMEVEMHDHHTEPEDVYLLCSDGLTDMVTDAEIGEVLMSSQSSLEDACGALVQRANDNGGMDNVSVILIKIRSRGDDSGLLGRFLRWVA
jgi:PPM family protein phosphatase